MGRTSDRGNNLPSTSLGISDLVDGKEDRLMPPQYVHLGNLCLVVIAICSVIALFWGWDLSA